MELTADTAGRQRKVRISPLLSTNFFFNVPLLRGGVALEKRELFPVMTVDEDRGVITLMPSSMLPEGKELLLTVRFADDALPESATFMLSVHPTRVEHQVNVYRRPRSGESYKLEARQERERTERCEVELARVRAEQQHPGGLLGLIEDGLLVAAQGVEARDLSVATMQQRPNEALQTTKAFSYRARAQGRVAIVLKVKNPHAQSWAVDEDGAQLVSQQGTRLQVLRVWPLEPIPAGGGGRVIVEAEASEEEARGTYLLKLVEVNGLRTFTLPHVTFP